MADSPYLPALRFRALTGLYDPVVRATTRERAFKDRLVALAATRPGERVLDLGCGTATLALAIARREPTAVVSGVDGDEEMLAQGRAKARRAGHSLDLRQAMAQDLPYDAGAFDLVVSSLFFHHLVREVKQQVAAELVRVLRPGGRVAIADWGRPQDPLMTVASLGIRLLDGAESTHDNFAGRLPRLLGDAGLTGLTERDAFRTMFGRMVLLTGTRPA